MRWLLDNGEFVLHLLIIDADMAIVFCVET